MAKKHTFTYLQASPFNDADIKGDIGMGVVATMNINNLNYPENRDQIIRAVNMHDELVNALSELKSQIVTIQLEGDLKRLTNERRNMLSAALLQSDKLLIQASKE